VQCFGRGFRKIFIHLVLARDILPNNTSAIRPILVPSVQQQGRGRAPSSPITDGTDYLSTVRPELGRDYQNPVGTVWRAVRTGLCRTLPQTYLSLPANRRCDHHPPPRTPTSSERNPETYERPCYSKDHRVAVDEDRVRPSTAARKTRSTTPHQHYRLRRGTSLDFT